MREKKEKHKKQINTTKFREIEEGNKLLKSKRYKCEITDLNTYLFHEGKNYTSYAFMGSHIVHERRKKGVRFTTWAPNAKYIYVTGDFCDFEIREEFKMLKITEGGIWSLFIENIQPTIKYKYVIEDSEGKYIYKSDPYAFQSEMRPNTASIVVDNSRYKWDDRSWMTKRRWFDMHKSPINIYEVNLGSWRKKDNTFMNYREVAKELPQYLNYMGYTHVEIMPIMEHPLDKSWGYQTTGYYSVTSRYGNKDDFKYLVDELHKAKIGIILDWVPGHFCKDLHALYKFDGGYTYEYDEEWKANNAGWGTYNFDLGKSEVKSFLISNALYWFREFHIDGIRVDAVSNMLYLDYDRKNGEWKPNKYGGNGNLEALSFLRELNMVVKEEYPNVMMIAEESTAWPNISKSNTGESLGFDFKWNMGWMHDTLEYIREDPINRKYHHNKMTFSMTYNYSENFILSISHDEVVYGKGSFINKMWGDYWNKFAGVRVFMTHMIGHPGKKLMFMGCEIGQFDEWKDYEQIQWNLIDNYEMHKKLHDFFRDINHFYINNLALWKYDYEPKGYEWINDKDNDKSIFSFIRLGDTEDELLIFICNYTPVIYEKYRVGVPLLSSYKEIFNSDNEIYGGTGLQNEKEIIADEISCNNRQYSIEVKIPPMAAVILKLNNINKEE